MKVIDKQLLDQTSEAAKLSPRLRMNHNFHDDTTDPLNRLINAIEPDSYIRPHRHQNPDKEEIFLLLRGKAVFFLFDDQGNITNKLVVSPRDGIYGAEIVAGLWHCLLVLETGTVVYEIKKGPFAPLAPENLAPWSPPAEDREAVLTYMNFLKKNI
ncbi:MAG: WbuC family cupin fold metalloprotein [Massilibacteroides sp.]|nr:WbuC family cupin fold metalloprotein [Massilibacteroides sp.]MDD3061481.1 WbuC family cupin fold metalloprotein [Massilibacteroides sp.]MDD4114538.1 WbuC family cupin fold metalloprotein [Massilibacteroides sp.]MDD4659229.1 WbuC family cupin fold metalloprotein [Massilibacteroides sp.]